MAADDVVELGNKGEQLTVTLCPTGNVGKAGSGIEHCLDSTETGVGTQDCLFFGGGAARPSHSNANASLIASILSFRCAFLLYAIFV